MIDLEFLKGKKIGIFGLGLTGDATYNALKQYAELVCYDDSEKNREEFITKHDSFSLKPLNDSSWSVLDMIILSPGVPTSFPAPHEILSIAKVNGIPIYSDIDLLYMAKPHAKYIGITGTNGKSTTTALIHHIFKNYGYDIGGNIGFAALSLENNATGYVIELSSFQLEITNKLMCDAAIILNITPDHIDRHGTMENYINAKKSIIDKTHNKGLVVINYDDLYSSKIAAESSFNNIFLFSTDSILENGLSVNGGFIYFQNNIYQLPNNKFLQGKHNYQNIAAAFAVSIFLGLEPEEILDKMENFIGLPHRMQFVDYYKNMSFYNDSKATNAEAAEKSLSALSNIYWIAGGVAKDGGISTIEEVINRNVTKCYFYGEAKNLFKNQIKHPEIDICKNLEEAFKCAVEDAIRDKENVDILLAPACASYDQFKNYVERGDKFISLVKDLKS